MTPGMTLAHQEKARTGTSEARKVRRSSLQGRCTEPETSIYLLVQGSRHLNGSTHHQQHAAACWWHQLQHRSSAASCRLSLRLLLNQLAQTWMSVELMVLCLQQTCWCGGHDSMQQQHQRRVRH
jgi:hypothetical protein